MSSESFEFEGFNNFNSLEKILIVEEKDSSEYYREVSLKFSPSIVDLNEEELDSIMTDMRKKRTIVSWIQFFQLYFNKKYFSLDNFVVKQKNNGRIKKIVFETYIDYFFNPERVYNPVFFKLEGFDSYPNSYIVGLLKPNVSNIRKDIYRHIDVLKFELPKTFEFEDLKFYHYNVLSYPVKERKLEVLGILNSPIRVCCYPSYEQGLEGTSIGYSFEVIPLREKEKIKVLSSEELKNISGLTYFHSFFSK